MTANDSPFSLDRRPRVTQSSLCEALATGRQVNAACNRNTLRAALHEAPTVRALADFASGRMS